MSLSVEKYNKVSEAFSSSDGALLSALESFIETYKEGMHKGGLLVPVSIFETNHSGILESLVKFLKENHGQSFSQIAKLINRDQRTVYTAFSESVKKHKARFSPADMAIIPVGIFSNRKLGPLESLVLYLKEAKAMQFKEIAALLKRDYATIWLTYNNAKKKVGKWTA